MIDRYTKVILTIIALALSVLATRPFYEARPAVAQSPLPVRIVGSDTFSLITAGPLRVICDSGCKSN